MLKIHLAEHLPLQSECSPHPAETDQDLCYKINRDAVRNLAQVAQSNGSKLIHVSTDYVFDGESAEPYTEEDITNPISVYGSSKLEGEEKIRTVFDNYLIITILQKHLLLVGAFFNIYEDWMED